MCALIETVCQNEFLTSFFSCGAAIARAIRTVYTGSGIGVHSPLNETVSTNS